MSNISYDINKGINRPIEFRGLKAQYIYYLAIGLAVLLVTFAFLYIAGTPVLLCAGIVGGSGTALFMIVFRYSHKYGEHGLSKLMAFRQLPSAIVCRSRQLFFALNPAKEKQL